MLMWTWGQKSMPHIREFDQNMSYIRIARLTRYSTCFTFNVHIWHTDCLWGVNTDKTF